MQVLNMILVIIVLIISSGCATIVHGTRQDIAITTDPAGAGLSVDGRENYISPAVISMSRKDNHVVQIDKDGYQKEAVNIKQTMSLATLGDMLAGGIIGYVVDAKTGAQCRLIPDNIYVHLRPVIPKTQMPAVNDQGKN